jgi:hypothetical protein
MRTTIDIPETTLKRAKAAAALQGRSLKRFVVEAIESSLHAGSAPRRGRVSLPLVPSKRPGSVRLTGGKIARLLTEEDGIPPS